MPRQATDLALFAVLVVRKRAVEVCTQLWHERFWPGITSCHMHGQALPKWLLKCVELTN